jgi:ubiquinone/menaquinone biosynthesis C-methylase UbiE
MGYGASYDVQTPLHADVTNLQFPNGFANGIIILHVLEHVRELQKATEELMQVLVPVAGSSWRSLVVPRRGASRPAIADNISPQRNSPSSQGNLITFRGSLAMILPGE